MMINEYETSLVSSNLSNLEERIPTFIRPPYPPKISPKEILIKSNQTKKPTKKTAKNNNNGKNKNNTDSNNNNNNNRQKDTKRMKSPNAFIIYRNEYVKE